MNKVLIKSNRDITAFASTDKSRYVLGGVHYNANLKVLEATDGKVLIRVPVSLDENEMLPAGQAQPLDCIIPIDTYRAALKALPKKGDGHVELQTNKVSEFKTEVTLQNCNSTTKGEVIDGQYPTVDQVIPDRSKATVKFALSARLLKKLATYADKHGKDTGSGTQVTFWLETPTSGISFEFRLNDGDIANGVLMPIRTD